MKLVKEFWWRGINFILETFLYFPNFLQVNMYSLADTNM